MNIKIHLARSASYLDFRGYDTRIAMAGGKEAMDDGRI
jgi:hypothetical protein